MEQLEIYKAIFNESSESILVLDDSGKICLSNAKTENFLGYNSTELYEQSFSNFSTQKDIIFELLSEKKSSLSIELVTKSKGSVRANISSTHISTLNGDFVLLKIQESKIDNSIEDTLNFRAVIENTPDSIFTINSNYEIVYLNEVFKQIFFDGFGVHLEKGMRILDYVPDFISGEWKKKYDTVLTGNRLFFEDTHTLGDVVSYFEVEMNPLFVDGNVEGISIYTRDISIRKNTEIKFAEKSKFSESLIELNPGILYVYDIIEQRNVFSNDGIHKILGYDIDEIQEMGNQLIPLLMEHSDFTDYKYNITQTYAAAIDGEQIVHQYRMKHKLGYWVWIESLELIYNRLPDGSAKQIFGIGHDITNRKLIEDELISSQSNINAILNCSLDSIWSIDSNYIITYINTYFKAAFLASFGINLEVGLRILDYVPAEASAIWKERYDRCLKNEAFLFEDQMEIAPEVFIYMEGSMNPVSINGEVVGLCSFVREITPRKRAEIALKESENKYRTIFDNIYDVFFQTDLSGTILEISPSIYKFLAIDRKDLIGKSNIEFYSNPEERKTMIEIITKNGEIRDYVFQFKSPNSNLNYASLNGNLVKDEFGKPKYLEGILRDVTERKKNELEIEEQNKRLIVQNDELEQFAYITSHDLQEPLRTLISFSSLIQEEFKGKLNDDADMYLGFILQASRRMQELVKGLLDYSRIGKERELESVDCNEILNGVLFDLTATITQTNASITVQNLPKLKASPIELRQLFQNLISNAIKFRNKEVSPIITISVVQIKGKWLFSLKDNGIGIDETEQEKIFVIFKRLHNRNEYEGTGIGLSHCKKIVELHGGTIWVDSKLGQGSVFNFTLESNN